MAYYDAIMIGVFPRFLKKHKKSDKNRKYDLLSLWICNIIRFITNCLYTIYLYDGEGVAYCCIKSVSYDKGNH